MSPLTSRVNRVVKVASRDAASDDGKSCSNNAWSCLNTAGQFGVIFSIIIVVITIAWVYWYTVIRPRQERIRESGEDIELDLGDGRTVVVSSGPYQRTVVFRGARSPTPPPPAYRPPTPGAGVIVPPGFATTTDSLPPSPRASHTQIWPPQTPPRRPQTPQNVPPQSMSTPNFVQGYPFPGSYSQPIPLAMYPPQVMVPGPPPTPPAMMYPRAQPQTYLVIPPPPPRPPDMPAQGLIPPPPPPPPPPPSQPPNGGIYQQPTGTDSQVRTRPPSPGHASTIEDDDSDRGGSLPPASRQERSPSRGRSPPAGGSQFTRSRTPSPSERRRQHARRRQAPSPSRSPPRGRQRKRSQQENQGRNPPPQQDDSKSDNSKSSDTSYKSSTSLDSDMCTDYDNLFVEHDGRKRGEEAERLQKLVDRIDKEEEEEREHRSAHGEASGGDKLSRLPGQPMRPAIPRAETANAAAKTSVEQQDPQGSQVGNGAHETHNEESQKNRPERQVAFQQPSLEVLESRIGRPSHRSPSPARIPNREDLNHGESRVGRRRRTPSPDERIVERPVAPVPSGAESRIGRPQPPSPPREHPVVHRGSRGFPGTGESRVGHHSGRKRRGTHPPETISPGAGSDYYNTHDATHGGHPTIDDGFLLSIARSEGPPSSAGATCGTRSHASSESNDRRRRMGLTPSRFNRERDQRTDEGATPYLRSPSPEESDDDEQKKHSPKPSWGSRLASILPTIARLTTNNPVVREVADDIADEVRNRERREGAARGWPARGTSRQSISQGPQDDQQGLHHLQPPQRLPGPRQRHDARRPRSQGRRDGPSRLPRPSRDQYRGHRRRPSTIAEEPRNSLQLTLEHAAERLAEEAVGSDMDRARDPGGGLGGHADAMPGQHDQRRRRPRRSSRATES